MVASFLPSLVCLIDNALKGLSEWHAEYDLDMDVRVAQVTKLEDAEKTVSEADVILIEFVLLKIPFYTLLPGKYCSLPETGRI